MNSMSQDQARARDFIGGERLAFEEANALWRQLKNADELALARRVLERLRGADDALNDGVPADRETRDELCRQAALITSKDPELGVSERHHAALEILKERFDLDSADLRDSETVGIAAAIYKRRYEHFRDVADLTRAAGLYGRAADEPLGEDAYVQINCAYVNDLLAAAGVEPEARRSSAARIRERIANELPATESWWNAATRAEALFGLGRFSEATAAIAAGPTPAASDVRTTANQIAQLAYLREPWPFEREEIREFFETLLPAAADASSVMTGKVGLALSGGGFRASFYHLGLLARLAELDVLRRIDVLSCVSGGSIVGASYWLALRRRMLQPEPLDRDAYLTLVTELIRDFRAAVGQDLRGAVQEGVLRSIWRLVSKNEPGALDSARVAAALDKSFYSPLVGAGESLQMHDLAFTPSDHPRGEDFNPTKHNWRREHKVPALVLNSTTVNTGHAWQFTPTWMGESPWAVHSAADSVPRLEWSTYQPSHQWETTIGRAVAASAAVPMAFTPMRIEGMYEQEIDVQLVDGGIFDNQGVVSLLAMNCDVVLASDAAGQLMLLPGSESGPKATAKFAMRQLDTLMARVRTATSADLSARKESNLLHGLMVMHMKEGLDADTIRLIFSQESYDLRRSPLTAAGVRRDFQEAIAELRTDLDDFTDDEANALMACGYQMGSKAFERDVGRLSGLWEQEKRPATPWAFQTVLEEITSTDAASPGREALLDALRAGKTSRGTLRLFGRAKAISAVHSTRRSAEEAGMSGRDADLRRDRTPTPHTAGSRLRRLSKLGAVSVLMVVGGGAAAAGIGRLRRK